MKPELRKRLILDAIAPYYPVITYPTQLPTVPRLLTQRQQEFCVATDFSPAFVAAVCQQGYLPMGELLHRLPLLLINVSSTLEHRWGEGL